MRSVKLPQVPAVRREDLAALQDDLVGRALEHAARSPFYASRLVPGGLAVQEVTTKDDLRRGYPFGFLATDRREIASYHESSGTSGEPTSSYFTESDWDDIASRFVRNAVDLVPEDAVLVKTPYAMVTTAHQMHRAARLRGAMVVPADNRSSAMPYPRVVRLLRDIPISVAWCMPTEALLWARAAQIAGLDPARDFPRFRAFVVAGEPLSRARKARLGELFGARAQVFEDYGSTETGSLAGECTHGVLHLWADRVLPEVHDPETNRFARSGTGQLVITTLFREAMPLVRYALEDTVTVDDAPCACGSPLPTIHVLGRTVTRAVTQGKPIFAGELDEAVFSLPAAYGVLFYRARWTRESLTIEVEAAEARGRVARDLGALVESRLGLRASVSAVPLGAIVDPARLTAEAPFQKPRFLFGPGEDWSAATAY